MNIRTKSTALSIFCIFAVGLTFPAIAQIEPAGSSKKTTANTEIGAASKMFKWKDENGKVHFGDTVPPNYKSVAKPVAISPINTIAPEEKVRIQNETAAARLRRQDAINDSKKSKQIPPKRSPSEFKLTREYCRDNTKTVKQRTECFNAIDRLNK